MCAQRKRGINEMSLFRGQKIVEFEGYVGMQYILRYKEIF